MLKNRHAPVEIWVRRHGRITYHQKTHNEIVRTANSLLADLFREHPLSSPARALAFGSDSTAVTASDVKLGAEVGRVTIPPAGTNTDTVKNLLVGTKMVIFQSFTPLSVLSISETGLFGDIVEVLEPTITPILAANTTEGSLPTGTYEVGYTWRNGNGESVLSSTANIAVTGPNGQIEVIMPALPNYATHARVYAAAQPDPVLLSGSSTTSGFTISTVPGGAVPPVTNTSTIPGEANSGRLFNRALIGPISTIGDGSELVTIRLQPDFK